MWVSYETKTLRGDVQNVLRKAATQLHIRTQSGASPSRNEGFREFEADLSALFFKKYVRTCVWNSRNKELWDSNWHESDDFFYDNPEIADKYGLVTCIGDYPIGFVTWDPRNAPEYVEIGHNGIRSEYKRKGYGIYN